MIKSNNQGIESVAMTLSNSSNTYKLTWKAKAISDAS